MQLCANGGSLSSSVTSQLISESFRESVGTRRGEGMTHALCKCPTSLSLSLSLSMKSLLSLLVFTDLISGGVRVSFMN